MSARAWLGCALLLAAAGPALAGVKDGVEAWSNGDYTKAVAEWQGPVATGDPDAQFNLAQAYKLGKGVPADLKRAEGLYLRAAQQGHLQAADNYGLLLFQSGRREQAMAWLIRSAERGEPRAQYVLGIAHFNGDLVPKDPVRAYALMTRAVAAGLETAKATLATMDEALPLAERQQGVALAAELESKANATRVTQLAAAGLGPAPVRKREPASAGADYAKPAVLVPPVAIAISPPPPVAVRLPPPTVASKAFRAAGGWRIQLGAFGVTGNAQNLWAKLKSEPALAGHQASFVPAGKLTRLLAGPFATRAEAQAACAGLNGQPCMTVQN